tara:strand:- start:7 stop:216 length:210 start_codon:yes stop_codon:yes gene_type:complete
MKNSDDAKYVLGIIIGIIKAAPHTAPGCSNYNPYLFQIQKVVEKWESSDIAALPKKENHPDDYDRVHGI